MSYENIFSVIKVMSISRRGSASQAGLSVDDGQQNLKAGGHQGCLNSKRGPGVNPHRLPRGRSSCSSIDKGENMLRLIQANNGWKSMIELT